MGVNNHLWYLLKKGTTINSNFYTVRGTPNETQLPWLLPLAVCPKVLYGDCWSRFHDFIKLPLESMSAYGLIICGLGVTIFTRVIKSFPLNKYFNVGCNFFNKLFVTRSVSKLTGLEQYGVRRTALVAPHKTNLGISLFRLNCPALIVSLFV